MVVVVIVIVHATRKSRARLYAPPYSIGLCITSHNAVVVCSWWRGPRRCLWVVSPLPRPPPTSRPTSNSSDRSVIMFNCQSINQSVNQSTFLTCPKQQAAATRTAKYSRCDCLQLAGRPQSSQSIDLTVILIEWPQPATNPTSAASFSLSSFIPSVATILCQRIVPLKTTINVLKVAIFRIKLSCWQTSEQTHTRTLLTTIEPSLRGCW